MNEANLSVCTNCHYIGKGTNPGTGGIELLLWIFLTPIAIFYSLWRGSKKQTRCPKCRQSNMIPSDTPKAQEIISHAPEQVERLAEKTVEEENFYKEKRNKVEKQNRLYLRMLIIIILGFIIAAFLL